MKKSTTTKAAQGKTVDAMVDTVESEGAYRGSPSIYSETSYIGEISDTESGEDEDLALQSDRSVEDNNPKRARMDSTKGVASLDVTGRVAWPQASTPSAACHSGRAVKVERRSSINHHGS